WPTPWRGRSTLPSKHRSSPWSPSWACPSFSSSFAKAVERSHDSAFGSSQAKMVDHRAVCTHSHHHRGQSGTRLRFPFLRSPHSHADREGHLQGGIHPLFPPPPPHPDHPA